MKTDGLTLAVGSTLGVQLLDEALRGTTLPVSSTEGDLWELTEAEGSNVVGVYEYAFGAWTLRSPNLSLLSYDLSGSVLGKPEPNATVMFFVAPRSFFLAASLAGAIARSELLASGQQDFYIILSRDGVPTNLGTIRFTSASDFGQFLNALPSDTLVRRGDTVSVITAAGVDTEIANISFTLCGYLTA